MSSLKSIKISVMAGQFVSMKSVTTAHTDMEAAVVKLGLWSKGGGGGSSVDSQSRRLN